MNMIIEFLIGGSIIFLVGYFLVAKPMIAFENCLFNETLCTCDDSFKYCSCEDLEKKLGRSWTVFQENNILELMQLKGCEL